MNLLKTQMWRREYIKLFIPIQNFTLKTISISQYVAYLQNLIRKQDDLTVLRRASCVSKLLLQKS